MNTVFDRNDLGGGWIYIIMTSADYNRFKLGRTTENPLLRAKKLRTGDPFLALEAAYFIPADEYRLSQYEAVLHQEFQELRIACHDESKSEWFRGTARWACEWIESKFEDWFEQTVTGMHAIGSSRVCRAYEADLESFYGPPPVLASDGLPM